MPPQSCTGACGGATTTPRRERWRPDILSTLHEAIRCAELGYHVFPCAPGTKVPLTPHGFQDATTDVARIEAWWKQRPEVNVAMPTVGLLVVDVDGPDNPWPGDPDKVMDLSRGPVSLTPRGGRHFIFRQPPGKSWGNTAGKIAPKVDTRGNGGYMPCGMGGAATGRRPWRPRARTGRHRATIPRRMATPYQQARGTRPLRAWVEPCAGWA
jgi:hypothetical protein